MANGRLFEPLFKPLMSPNLSVRIGLAFEPETEALVARFTTPPTSDRKLLINTLIKALKSGVVWPKLDAFYILAAANAQAAQRNWLADQYNLTEVNAPTFTADRGYASNGTTAYLQSWQAWNSGLKGQDDVHAAGGVYSSSAAEDASILGTFGTADNNLRLIPRNTGDVTLSRLNNSGTDSFANTDARGRYIMSRVTAAEYAVYKNGVLALTKASTSVAPSTGSFVGLRHASTISTKIVTHLHHGKGLSAEEILATDTAIAAYLSAVGAI